MKRALYLPPFGPLADVRLLADLAREAEELGWNAMFVWDHVLRVPTDPQEILDPWICLSAMALATTTLRVGPMVTPLTRRRPIKVAREALTLDHLSNGRLTLGLGLGVDSGGELTRFGETVDARIRADRLDEAAAILDGLWSGEPFSFRGEHFVVDEVTCLPRPVQRPRIPMWFAARGGARRPVRRAARYDGLFPVDASLEDLRSMIDTVRAERGSLDGFDVAAIDTEPRGPSNDHALLAELGVTWLIRDIRPGATGDEVRAALRS